MAVTDEHVNGITRASGILSLAQRSAGELGSPASVARWAGEALHLDPADVDVLALHRHDVVELHRAVRGILDSVVNGEPVARGHVERLNEMARGRPTVPELVFVAGGLEAATRALSSSGGTVVAAMAAAAITLLGGSDGHRIRRCPARRCGRFFLAGRPSQRWCSAACGNRTRVARHHERVRAAGRSGGAA
jgi:predicted RNA-binding Zn ribbon-like protein